MEGVRDRERKAETDSSLSQPENHLSSWKLLMLSDGTRLALLHQLTPS